MEGTLQERGLGDVLLTLARQARTGILTVQAEDEIIALAFLEGAIVSADALNRSLEEGLGGVLEALDLVSPAHFAELVAEYEAGGGAVTELLVERGFLSREQLLEALRVHTYELARQAAGFGEGDYKFYRGDEVSYEEGIRPIPVEELLVRASRDLGSEALLSGWVATTDTVFRRLDTGDRADADSAEAASAALRGVDEDAVGILAQIDGRRTLAELAESTGVSEYRVAFLLNRWELSGMVERVERAGRAEPEPEPRAERRAPPAPGLGRRLGAWSRRRLEALRSGGARGMRPWPARVLGLTLGVLMSWSLVQAPDRFLLPFPWQGGLREELRRERERSDLAEIRLANAVHFLVEGRFATGLQELLDEGLMAPSAAADGAGQPYAYSGTVSSYVVGTPRPDDADARMREAITGNFLMDPELETIETSRTRPLVLLD